MRIVVGLGGDRGRAIARALEDEDVDVVTAHDPRGLAADLPGADALVLVARRDALTPGIVSACDRNGVRIVALADRASERRLARSFGLAEALPMDAEGWRIVEAVVHAPHADRERDDRHEGVVVAVWGPHGAPGRTTIAIELAVELARSREHVALVDADTHAPAVATLLGLADEGPGFAAACRQSDRSEVDAGELTRLSEPIGGPGGVVDVLTGINRTGRWPELSEHRVAAALAACRRWAAVTVVDVAAALEQDEEIVSDLDGPRRNAATIASVRSADLVVAVAASDPVGLTRFVRGHAELRALVERTPVQVVVNRVRQGPIGVDPRGQVRRTLDRFAGIEDVSFVPSDPRAADAALLAGTPIGAFAARSALVQAVRRLAARVPVVAGP